jgi:toxin ParE1/3/4
MRYVFHPEALAEYSEAVQYYAEQRSEVAQMFINAIEDAVYRIRESPTRWAIVDEDVRRCLTRKFPYSILYTIEQDYI